MGTIPLSSIVTVNISATPTFTSQDGFGTLLCVTKETGVLSLSERVRAYADADSVSEDWGSDAEVTTMATTYFSQSPKPTSLMIGIRFETDQSAELVGGSVPETELSTIQAITDGSFSVTIDGVSNDITGLDFSGDTTMAEVATTVQNAIQAIATGGFTGALFTYTGTGFKLVSGTAGASSTMSYMTEASTGTAINDTFKMKQGQSLKADGLDGEKVTESLTAINEANSNWYGVALTKELRDDAQVNSEDVIEEVAAWCEARVKVFFSVTNNELTYSSASQGDISYVLSQKSLSRTLLVYSSYPDEYPEVSVAGRAFSVDFSTGNPSITLKFKQLPNITVEDISYNQKLVIDSKGCNALISIAGNTMFAEGVMVGGRFFDEIHGLDWLQNEIETNVFGLLYTSGKIAYTDTGIQKLAQKVRQALESGVDAGLLAAGEDSDGNFLPTGYEVVTVSADAVNDTDKESRYYDGLSFTALGAGAIHSVTINGLFER